MDASGMEARRAEKASGSVHDSVALRAGNHYAVEHRYLDLVKLAFSGFAFESSRSRGVGGNWKENFRVWEAKTGRKKYAPAGGVDPHKNIRVITSDQLAGAQGHV